MNLTFPKRYLLSLLAFFGFFNAFVLRSNLSIAIVPMIKSNVHLLSTNTTVIIKKKRSFFSKSYF